VGDGREFAENSAVTTTSPLGVSVQVPGSEQPPPDQPAKVDPIPGLAVKVTCSPPRNCAEQAKSTELQSIAPGLPIPSGLLVTVPEPFPASSTMMVLGGSWMKVAVTSASTVVPGMVQVPVPEQGPDQPVNAKPGAGVAVRVTGVPGLKGKLHPETSSPQAIPPGLLVTITPPLPPALTVTVSPGPCVHCTCPPAATPELFVATRWAQ
jgi:hypothetical protein